MADPKPNKYNLLPSDIEIFRSKVGQVDARGCTEWIGTYGNDGYGVWKLRSMQLRASRSAWTLLRGPVPDGLLVCHVCDNPRCVNVEHLFLGTPADNMHDRDAKGRHDAHRGAAQKSKLTDEKVAKILHLLAAGDSHKSIGARYGVCQQLISKINSGKSWPHIERPLCRQ